MSDGPRSTCGGSVRKLHGLSDILLAHHDDVGDANAVACIFAARAWLGEIDRAGKDGVAYLRGQRCPHSPQMHSPGTWKPMISKLRRYTASHRVPGNSASDDQLPVRMGVCGPLWERVSCVHREVRAAQGAACTDDQT